MRAQSCNLGAEDVSDVHDVIGRRPAHDPDIVDAPGIEALVGQQGRVGEGIAGVGINRKDRRLSGGEVVGVGCGDPRPIAFGRLDQHALWSHLTDHPTDVSP